MVSTKILEQEFNRELPPNFNEQLVRLLHAGPGRLELAFPPNPEEEAIYSFLFESPKGKNPLYSLFMRLEDNEILSIAGLKNHKRREQIYQNLRDVYNSVPFERERIDLFLFPTEDERPKGRDSERTSNIYLISEKNLAVEVENVLKQYDAIGFLKGSKDSNPPYWPSVAEERERMRHICTASYLTFC